MKKKKKKDKTAKCQESDLPIEVSEVQEELEAIDIKEDDDYSARDLEQNPDDRNVQGAVGLSIGPVEE